MLGWLGSGLSGVPAALIAHSTTTRRVALQQRLRAIKRLNHPKHFDIFHFKMMAGEETGLLLRTALMASTKQPPRPRLALSEICLDGAPNTNVGTGRREIPWALSINDVGLHGTTTSFRCGKEALYSHLRNYIVTQGPNDALLQYKGVRVDRSCWVSDLAYVDDITVFRSN